MKSHPRLLIAIVVVSFLGACSIARFNQERNVGGDSYSTASDPIGPTRELAFVANSLQGSVSIVDIESQTVIRNLDVIPDGTRVGFFRDPVQSLLQGIVEGQAGKNYVQDSDLSRDGRVLFVSRGYLADIAAFELTTGNLLWRTPVAGLRADHMDISPDGRFLYASSIILSGNRVQVLDTSNGEKIGEFRAGQWPHDVQTSHDGSQVFVASLGNMLSDEAERGEETEAYTVTQVDASSLDRVAQFEFPAGVRPFHVTQDGAQLYAQLSNTHDLIHYDLTRQEILNRVTLPIDEGVTEADWDFEAPHHGVALNADESILCIAGRASDYAALVDAKSLNTIAIIDTGDAPSWATINETSELCLIPNTRSDELSIIDLNSRNLIATLKVQRGPKHVSIGHVPESVVQALQRDS